MNKIWLLGGWGGGNSWTWSMVWWLPGGEGLGEGEKELRYVVVRGELALGGGHVMQHLDGVLWSYAPGTCVVFADQCHQ